MKRFLYLLILFAPLLITSCQGDEITEEDIEPSGNILLTTDEIIMKCGATETIQVNVNITGTTLEADHFILVKPDGSSPDFVTISSAEFISERTLQIVLQDMRDESSPQKYSHAVFLTHFPTGIKSTSSLLIRSADNIPVVYLTTSIAQNNIDKNNWMSGKISIDGGAYVDLEEMNCEVKGRGNSTWSWEKKPYAIRLESKTEVLGMPKHKRWCLIANYMDRTHLRNRMAYHISEFTNLAYTTRNRYVELYFNGSYQGLYLLTEQIKVDKNRVNIKELSPSDNDEKNITGGYLLEFDTNFDEDKKFVTTFTSIPVNLKYPDAADISEEQWAYIQEYMKELDMEIRSLKSGRREPDKVYELLDRDSMIDYWIVYEIMANHEILHPKSVYFYKDRGGKLVAGPVWDFDYATLIQSTATSWINYNLSWNQTGFPWYEKNWWNFLMQNDPEFKAGIKKRWNELYPSFQTIPEFIDQEYDYILPAVIRNNQKWTSIRGTGFPNGDENLSFEAAVERLINVYTSRIEWMNSQINSW